MQDLVETLREDGREFLLEFLGDVVRVVGLVRRWKQHRRDAGPVCGQYLLLDAADREHLAGESDLAGHRHVGVDRAL